MMRLGIFTDPHYSSREITCGNRYNSLSLEKIRQAYRFFGEKDCDLIVCLGDLIDREDDRETQEAQLVRVAEIIRGCPIPSVCLMGNHDAFAFTEDSFYGILGSACRPSDRVPDGKRLVFLDACYFKDGRRYKPGDSDWTDTFYPFEDELQRIVSASKEDIYVFLHQNLDPQIKESHRLYNADRVNAILRSRGNVKAVFQGHYHPGARHEYNGIRYITFPAMCERENAFFIEEV
ncbi:MAG: metallophosphoesterase [Clostridia bacterium]|nr:metallophosphoesterase [Clostridia bacterium]